MATVGSEEAGGGGGVEVGGKMENVNGTRGSLPYEQAHSVLIQTMKQIILSHKQLA